MSTPASSNYDTTTASAEQPAPRRNVLRRIVAGLVGGALIVVGLALMVLPGPGLIIVLGGIVILANEYPWAQRAYKPVHDRAMQAAEASVATSWRIAGSVLAGVVLIGLGAGWIVAPGLPFGGIGTGASLILSGILLLALLVYSHRRVSGRTSSGALF